MLERLLRDAELAAQIGHRCAELGLLQNRSDLLDRKTFLLHDNTPPLRASSCRKTHITFGTVICEPATISFYHAHSRTRVTASAGQRLIETEPAAASELAPMHPPTPRRRASLHWTRLLTRMYASL